MNVKNLKFLAGTVVYKSEKLSEASKIQLLNFIKESDSYDIMSLLLDRKIMNLDETAKTILEDRFMKSKYGKMIKEIATRKTMMSNLGALGPQNLIGLGIPMIAYRAIRAAFDQCSRHCGAMNMNYLARQMCMIKCKREHLNKTSTLLKGQLSNCSKGKDPEKCKQKVQKLLSKIDGKIMKVDQTIAQYNKEIAGKSAKAQLRAAVGSEKGKDVKKKLTNHNYNLTKR